jgi:hypothetical protein
MCSFIQLENEYGALTDDRSEEDVEYLKFLKEDYEKHGIVELLYTSDHPTAHGDRGSLPGGRHLNTGFLYHISMTLCTMLILYVNTTEIMFNLLPLYITFYL